MTNQINAKVQFIHAEQIFVYYQLTSEKSQNGLKKTPSHLAELSHLPVFIWTSFISPRWDPGKIKGDLT